MVHIQVSAVGMFSIPLKASVVALHTWLVHVNESVV